MADMLTRADLAKMPPHEIEQARKEGRIEGVGNGDEQQGGFADRQDAPSGRDARNQKGRVPLLEKQAQARKEGAPELIEEAIKSGMFDGIFDGADYVVNHQTGEVFEVSGTVADDDLEPIVRVQDAAGDEQEMPASQAFPDGWFPVTEFLYVKAREALDDPQAKATKQKLPLKPAYADAIAKGELVIVDPQTGRVLVRHETEAEKKAGPTREDVESGKVKLDPQVDRTPAADAKFSSGDKGTGL